MTGDPGPIGNANVGSAAAIFDARGRVLLVKHTYGHFNWEIPGGIALPGEPPLAGARREVEEETGLRLEGGDLSGVYYEAQHLFGPMIHFVFRFAWSGTAVATAHPPEIGDVGWFALDELPAPMSDFTEARIADALGDRPVYRVVIGRSWRGLATDPDSTAVAIEPWSVADRPLLDALLGDPQMTEHLGGPESSAKLDERQGRYERDSRQHRIVVDGVGVGFVGYWDKEWQGANVWETGWAVRREYQGRGLATQAMRLLLDKLRADGTRREVHAFPSVDNIASNAVCQKLGFDLLGAFDFEYPPGQALRCNDWCMRID